MYEEADKALQRINRRNLKRFDKLKQLPLDELNIIREVKKTYDDSEDDFLALFLTVAILAYIAAMEEARKSEEEAKRRAQERIDEDWLIELLEEADPVTLYEFFPEADRKAERLAEALLASRIRPEEVDKALKYWTRQIAQYAITVVDNATLQAFMDAGVERVMWNTQEDERVCEDCEPLDGQIFDIDDAPDKLHWNCRCYYTPVFD